MPLVSLLLLACAHKAVLSTIPPVLPAMEAPLYAAAPYTPSDPLVASLLSGPVDESLSGAAAAVALVSSEGGEVDGSTITWAAYRSGWPHAVSRWSLVQVSQGERPGEDLERDLADWSAAGATIGIARARGRSGDTWVALASTPWVTLEPFPRSLPAGAVFSWPVVDDGRWGDLRQLGIGPSLTVQEGPLTPDVPGEWIVELRGHGADGAELLLARVPLYVGEPPPYDGPFERPIDRDSPGDILSAINELRGLEQAPALGTDPTLDAAARKGLRTLLETGAADPGALDRLARLGYPEATELTCTGGTVSECVEDLWWSIDERRRLLERGYLWAGVASARGGETLTIVLTLSGE